MPSRAQDSNATRFPAKMRTLLMAGTTLCGVAALALAGGAARASILPTQLSTNLATVGAGAVNTKVLTTGVVTPSTANYVSTGATATLTLVAPRTLIDWTTFHVDAGSTLNFAFTNAPSDIVLNRVMGGTPGTNTIAIDAGGAVKGTFNGAVGGNIWFLAPDGVFINGTVTASGVLATNNTSVADLNLLSDAAATLKGELAVGGSLIDLSGITAASGATIDASGNLFLTGPETVTGDVMLESTRTLAINAPIVVEGAVPVTLAYISDLPTNLRFGAGGSLTFANADGSAATSSAGGSLTVNGQAYTLLYKLAQPGSAGPDAGLDDTAGIDNNTNAGGAGGLYALATDLTGTGTAANPQFTGALAGQGSNPFTGVFEGLGHTITGLTINDPVSGTATGGLESVGLFGFNSGTVRDLGLVGGSVTGANLANVGALAGVDVGGIVQDYATGAVSGGQDGAVGGLVGATGAGTFTGTITQSYATGSVTGAGASTVGSAAAGGLVGANAGVITQAYATGAVSGGPNMDLGGLAGENSGSINQTYATGAVSGGGAVIAGGLVGFNMGPGATGGPSGFIASGAFDTLTTGQIFGIGQDQNNQAANIATLTTSQLQSSGLPSGFDPTVWGGGSGGLYPFLTSFFPNGVQAVSDFAYADFNTTSLASGPTGPVSIGLIAGGAKIGEATTGANGYFYIAAPAGTLTNGETLLAYTAAGAPGSAHLSTATSAVAQSEAGLYAGVVIVPTAAFTLSTAPTLAQAQAQALAAAGANGDAQSSINSTVGLGLQAIGASFTIDQPLTTTVFGVQTAPGAPLTIAAPIVVNSGGELGLFSKGTLAIDAPITVNGVGGVFLTYDTMFPRNLSFGNGAALTYNTATGGPATSSQGGVLTINGLPYTLLYNLAQPGSTGPDTGVDDIAGIDNNMVAGGDSGFYALAINLTGTGTAANPQFTKALAGSTGFNGVLEGLGHTITNLTINDPTSGIATSPENVGLFGSMFSGVVRDIGIVGGSVVGGLNYTSVGQIAGAVYGPQGGIIESYATGLVSSGQNSSVGGLTGYLNGGMIGDYGAGTVSGGGLGAVGGLLGGLGGQGVIIQSYATGAVNGTTNDFVGGLAGYSQGGSITQAYATGAVGSGDGSTVGGLVGLNFAASTITTSYATGAATGGSGAVVGGLAGENQGAISQSYAAGPIGDAQAGSAIGGLVGFNDAGGSITQTLASGPVSGAASTSVGGLVGNTLGALGQGIAMGAVSGGLDAGGLVGHNGGGGTIMAGAFDTLTTGKTAGIGLDNASILQSGNIAALTTTQLQSTLPSGFDPLVWGGGTGGLYPFLTPLFIDGQAAVSGFAYADAGVTPLASGLGGPVMVEGTNGVGVATAFTGANGYFYIVVDGGPLPVGATLLGYTAPGLPGAATLFSSAGVANQSGVDLYGGAITVPTTAMTLMAAPTLAQARALALSAAGSVTDAQNAVNGATGLGLIATGASFTVDQPVSAAATQLIQTASGAPITVSAALTIQSGGSLGLLSGGTLTINAPITANGAAGVNLAYNTSSTTNFGFGNGASLTYNTAAGGPATASQGGVLTINGQVYTLLYNLAQPGSTGPDTGIDDIAGIHANSNAGGDSGLYALATNLAGTGTAASPQFSSALVGQGSNAFTGVFEGLGHTISGLTINDPVSGTPTFGPESVGLFGYNAGTVRDLGLVGGSVTGANLAYVGELAGGDVGTIVQDYATGAVRNGLDGPIGGLVGATGTTGTITRSYASGSVMGAGATMVNGDNAAGGLVGTNGGVITQSYATGAVNGGANMDAGGLVGVNFGSIIQTYATGAVSGVGAVITGGLVGLNEGPFSGPGGTIASGAFDTLTTGQIFGIGQDQNNQSANIAALTTSQLQTSGLPSGFDPTAWGGGSGGLYPFLTSFFPNGVQAVSDFAFAGFSRTSLASGAAGAVTIGLIAGGAKIGEATTGANGYFYIAAPAGTFTSGETLLAYTASGAPGAAHLSTASSAVIQNDSKIFAGVVVVPTAAVTLSTAPTLAQAQAQALAAAGVNGDAQTSINGATGLGLEATGASFTIDQPVTTANGFGVQTAIGAPLSVAAPIVVDSGGELALSSRGALAIDAAITVNGAGDAFLNYDAASPTNFSFGNGATLTYNTATGGPATSSQGGVLAINNQFYTLLYNLAQAGSTGPDTGIDDIAGIDANMAAGGDSGFYAVATNLTGTGTAASPQFKGSLAGAGANSFNGVFEGLGHTITNLTISDTVVTDNVGLFGTSSGTIRDIGLIGGAVSAAVANFVSSPFSPTTPPTYVGGLVGQSGAGGVIAFAYTSAAVNTLPNADTYGAIGGLVGFNAAGSTITNAYAAGAVDGGNEVGGLVGRNRGNILQSFAAGAVTGGDQSSIGGLVGNNNALIDQVYATGAVTGTGSTLIGGLVGNNLSPAGVITAGAFDTLTTGQTVAIGQDLNNQSGNIAALTTAQLQTGGLPAGFNATVWGGGGGLYPYLTAFFPNGVQAVSGVAYSDAGTTPIPSGAGGAVTVQLLAGGAPVGTAATGANGYYYIASPAGTFAAGESLQANIVSGGPAESGFFTPTTTFVAQPGVNIYGSSGALFILPSQGSLNLATPTSAGTLASATLAGGVVTSGTVGYASTGPVATLTLTASRTLIDWTTFRVGSGATLNFDFTNSAADIVLNRLAGGTITIDAGGAVNGFYGSSPGGNIWFLAGNGVLINGAVTAGGVLATNSTGVPNLNLLSDAAATLKGELAAGGLIDLTGAVSVTGAAIDGTGAILLTGAVDTGPAGAVNLVSTGSLTQTGGAITTGTLSGSSVGGTTLAGANQIAAIGDFTNTGGGGLTLIDTGALSVAAGVTIDAGGGTLALDDATGGIATGSGSILKAGADITLTATGGAAAIGGAVTAGHDIVIAAATFSDPQGALTAPGALTLALSDPNGVTLTAAPSAGLGSDIVAQTLLSPTVTIYEAATVTSTGAVTGGIGISSVTLPSVISSLGLFTNGVVTVTGPFLPGGANVSLIIGGPAAPRTPTEIKIENEAGSGAAGGAIGSPAAPFGSVSLIASGDILLGSSPFDSAAEQIPVTTAGGAVNPLAPTPDPPFTPTVTDRSDGAVFLDVVNLTIAAGGRVLQQNTSGPLSGADSGAMIGGNLTLETYNGAGPQNFDLYATFVGPTVTGAAAAASNRIILNTPATDPGRPLFRVDGCVIQSAGACTMSAQAAAAVGAQVATVFSSKPAPVVAPVQVMPVFLLTQPQAADVQDTSVIGATNEEIWRKPDRKNP
jgi:hypothetical protein